MHFLKKTNDPYNRDEVKHYYQENYLGDSIVVIFESLKYPGEPIRETKVYINGLHCCVIEYSQIENFINELKSAIQKYRI